MMQDGDHSDGGKGGELASLHWRGRTAQLSVEGQDDELRTYHLRSAGGPERDVERSVSEKIRLPYLRTGHGLFDGLFAMAWDDLEQNSIESIYDWQFNDGERIACPCFETGNDWHYVWTRDISYASDLGLAYLEPERTKNSLLFKLSPYRAEFAPHGGLHAPRLVAQDTGSGGSWPISTDRVVWILAASETLKHLPPASAADFAEEVYCAALATLEADHVYAFDKRLGLYKGETSFLDWREQSYPSWVKHDTLFLSESFALSTNVLHYTALRRTCELSRLMRDERSAELAERAGALHAAINRHFWDEQRGLYHSYIGPCLHPTPSYSYDLLGLALAVLHGVASDSQARRIFAAYPLTAAGAPVFWPAKQDVPVYHNRALWPFVSAYALRAARQVGHSPFITHAIDSLVRGAALALSNMENFEFLTQQSFFEDGCLSGPIINSRRQLWSIAAYLNMVVEGVFGLRPDERGMHLRVVLPSATLARYFSARTSIELRNLRVHGRSMHVMLRWPTDLPASGPTEIAAVSINGQAHLDLGEVAWEDLPLGRDNELVLELAVAPTPEQPFQLVQVLDPYRLSEAERRALFAPREPQIRAIDRIGTRVRIVMDAQEESGTSFDVHRDGELVATGIQGVVWEGKLPSGVDAYSFSVTQRYQDGGFVSAPSPCVTVISAEWSERPSAANRRLLSAELHEISEEHGKFHFESWGRPEQCLLAAFTSQRSGLHRLRLEYANPFGPVNAGITACVKQVEMAAADDGAEPGLKRQKGVIVMPHLGGMDSWGLSSSWLFWAEAGKAYRLRFSDGVNMSYLEHFQLYTAGSGGRSGPVNRAHIAGVQIDFVSATKLGCEVSPTA